LPCCRWRLKGQKPLPAAYPKEINTLGDNIRKRRLDLGLLQRDVAAQIGVNKDTIYNWEMNRTEPEVRFIPKIINFLGYTPYDPGWSFGEWLRAIRSTLGLSQEQLARSAGLDESTVLKWKREEYRPTKQKWATLKTFLRESISANQKAAP
jgi:transcriptional regulator with XRE-family HTH domain